VSPPAFDQAAAAASDSLAGKFIRDHATAAVPRAQALIGRIMMGERVPEDEMFETPRQGDEEHRHV